MYQKVRRSRIVVFKMSMRVIVLFYFMRYNTI